jgi:hypothetical protein
MNTNEMGLEEVETAKQFQLPPRFKTAATWVNTTRYCKYRQVILKMSENIARNM